MPLFDPTEMRKLNSDLRTLPKTESNAGDLLEKAIPLVQAMLEGKESPVFIDLDRDHEHGPIKGLSVFDGERTSVIPVSVSHRIVHINSKPFYVGREDGIAVLLTALAIEIDMVVKGLVRH